MKKIEKNNPTVALNVLYAKIEKIYKDKDFCHIVMP